ncbi:MAG: C45 family peptidase [Nitrososphaerales archaeon]|jgi:isopenicillin-N N-acyltransferase-like protein
MRTVLKPGEYPYITVTGSSPFERGFTYGSHYKTMINGRLDLLYWYFDKAFGLSREKTDAKASVFLAPLEDYSPDVYAEFKGTAEGAGLTLAQGMITAAYGEISHEQTLKSREQTPKSCTSFAAREGATEDGLTYVGQNNDERLSWTLNGEGETVTKFVQGNAPDALIYTYAGAEVLMGMNSTGMSVCINGIGYDSVLKGVHVLGVVREVLNQGTMDEAIESIERAKMSCAINFMIGTPKEIADIEANPSKIQVMRSDEDLVHSNHYLRPTKGVTIKKQSPGYKNSFARCSAMEGLVESKKGSLTLQDFQTFLCDHQNAPDSICAHVDKSKPAWHQGLTVDGMVFISEKKEGWIAKGNPCQTEFFRYKL